MWLLARLDPEALRLPWEQRGDADPQSGAAAAFPGAARWLPTFRPETATSLRTFAKIGAQLGREVRSCLTRHRFRPMLFLAPADTYPYPPLSGGAAILASTARTPTGADRLKWLFFAIMGLAVLLVIRTEEVFDDLGDPRTRANTRAGSSTPRPRRRAPALGLARRDGPASTPPRSTARWARCISALSASRRRSPSISAPARSSPSLSMSSNISRAGCGSRVRPRTGRSAAPPRAAARGGHHARASRSRGTAARRPAPPGRRTRRPAGRRTPLGSGSAPGLPEDDVRWPGPSRKRMVPTPQRV